MKQNVIINPTPGLGFFAFSIFLSVSFNVYFLHFSFVIFPNHLS